MISTRDLSGLPGVGGLRRLMQSLAMLDAILCPEWEHRYFSFDAQWGRGEQMGSMRDGSGDDLFALFNAAGCWVKGFAHEAPLSPYASVPKRVAAGMYDGVPAGLTRCLSEPAFNVEDVTFCIWRATRGRRWMRGAVALPRRGDADGSRGLLWFYDGRPETYRRWAEGHYERRVPIAAVRHVYQQRPLEAAVVESLNPARTVKGLKADAEMIGYPRS